MIARHFFVSGRVQGVGFRWFTMHRARALDLDGWVRNTPDGRVEVWAEGSESAVDALEAALKGGPPGAMVRSVSADAAEPRLQGRGFDVTF